MQTLQRSLCSEYKRKTTAKGEAKGTNAGKIKAKARKQAQRTAKRRTKYAGCEKKRKPKADAGREVLSFQHICCKSPILLSISTASPLSTVHFSFDQATQMVIFTILCRCSFAQPKEKTKEFTIFDNFRIKNSKHAHKETTKTQHKNIL